MFTYYKDSPDDVLYLSCFAQHLCIFAAFTTLLYEYVITLDKEIDFFWGRRLNGGSLLFFLGRYIPLLVRTMDISSYVVRMNESSCYKFAVAFQAMDSLQYLPCAAFAGARTWVFSRRNRALTAFVTVLSLIPVGLEYSKISSIEVRANPSFGCAIGLGSATSSGDERLFIASRVCLITSDVIVLVVTWFATYQTGVLQRTSQWEYTSFLETLFRDGIIHFCALLVLNVLDLVFSLPTIRNPDLNPSLIVVVFTGPAATILINRFLIHVQQVRKSMIQGFIPSDSEGISMQSSDASRELRFVRTFPQDQQTTMIPDPHDDLGQFMDSTMSETTSGRMYDTMV